MDFVPHIQVNTYLMSLGVYKVTKDERGISTTWYSWRCVAPKGEGQVCGNRCRVMRRTDATRFKACPQCRLRLGYAQAGGGRKDPTSKLLPVEQKLLALMLRQREEACAALNVRMEGSEILSMKMECADMLKRGRKDGKYTEVLSVLSRRIGETETRNSSATGWAMSGIASGMGERNKAGRRGGKRGLGLN